MTDYLIGGLIGFALGAVVTRLYVHDLIHRLERVITQAVAVMPPHAPPPPPRGAPRSWMG